MKLLLFIVIFVDVLEIPETHGAPYHPRRHWQPWRQPSERVIRMGDMLVNEGRLEDLQFAPMNGQTDEKYRWPRGVIPYVIDVHFSDAEVYQIEQAMVDIMNKSCIRFKLLDDEKDYIFIQRGDKLECFAAVGRQGGMQVVHLGEDPDAGPTGKSCILGTGPGPHELMHAVGFWHEMQREDRDDYIKVNLENIEQGSRESFMIMRGTSTFQLPFDFSSLMLYKQEDFALDGPTWEPVSGGELPGDHYTTVSDLDAAKIQAMYRGIC